MRSASELQQRASQLRQAVGADPEAGSCIGDAHNAGIGEWLRLATQVSDAITALAHDAHTFRLEQAAALRAEGVTITQLAQVFGVSRQRAGVLVSQAQAAKRRADT